MDQAKLFLSSFGGDGPGGDPGDPIGNSLRFRAGDMTNGVRMSCPVRTPGERNWTWSGWVKLGEKTATLFSPTSNVSPSSTSSGLYTNLGSKLWYQTEATNQADAWRSDGTLSDPSAWYHIVFSCDFDNNETRGYINGKLAGTNVVDNQFYRFDTTMGFKYGGSNYSDSSGNFYCAEVYLIDGQVLDPTTFGRYNTYDVWVPVKPEGLTFGDNGFHLDFSDPNDLGADRSPNGNDFTAIGFDTLSPNNWESKATFGPAYVSNVQSTSIIFNGQYDLTSSFNGHWYGNGATAGSGGYADDDLTGIFQAIDNITDIKLNVFPRLGTVTLFINGSEVGSVSNSSNTPLEMNVTWDGSEINSVILEQSGDTYYSIGGIKINDQLLVSSSGSDFDVMLDSPTQNYATLNPLEPQGRPDNITDANLQSYSTGYGAAKPAFVNHWFNETDRYYFEIPIGALGASSNQKDYGHLYWGVGNMALSGSLYATGRDSGTPVTPGPQIPWVDGDVVRIRTNGLSNFQYTVNDGVWQTVTISMPSPFMFGMTNSDGSISYFNFGQQPFLYNVPDGWTALQTQNLPEAPIANGRDHFRAITGSGDGAGVTPGANQRAGNFIKDLYSNEDGTYNSSITDHIFFILGGTPSDGSEVFDGNRDSQVYGGDSSVGGNWIYFKPDPPINITSSLEITTASLQTVRINGGPPTGDQVLTTTLTDVNIANPPTVLTELAIQAQAGLSVRLSRIVVDGETLIDTGILSHAQTTFPNGLWWIKDRVNTNQHQLVDSVRGSTVASTCPQSTKNTTYVPPAGDSVAWCWNSADPTTSGFNIIEFTGDANSTQDVAHGLPGTPEFIITGSQAASPGGFETFHVGCAAGQSVTIDAPRAQNTSSRYSGVDGTNITYGGDYNTNGQIMIAYAWTSVPGYSAFGSVSDGQDSFAYTGFRPAFLLTKQTGASGDWLLWDTTRNINNPSTIVSIVNGQQAEESGGTQQVDLLSNGIKFRGTSGSMSGNLIWAAFAENPFSSPVTAR